MRLRRSAYGEQPFGTPLRVNHDVIHKWIVTNFGKCQFYEASLGGCQPQSLRSARGLARAQQVSALVEDGVELDRKSTRLNSSHVAISYAVFCLKKKTL